MVKSACFSQLSWTQKSWLFGSLIGAILLGVLGVLAEPEKLGVTETRFTVEMSLKQVAPELDTTGKGLARELGLPLDAPKDVSLDDLGISQDQLDHAVEHILSHHPTASKYYVFVALVLFGLIYLTRVGRPRDADASTRKQWYPRFPYVAALVAAVVVCGFAIGKSPNPMEASVKLFKSMVGLYPSVTAKLISFIFFIALAVIGNKLICGWACPFGALQELIFSLPLLRRAKQRTLPFRLANSIRAALFVVALLLLFGVIGANKGFVIYHFLNPFNLFDLRFESWTILATVVVALALSLAIYRPFCYLVCPFGFISWIAERVSLTRVCIDDRKCTKCGNCVRACPSEAARGIVEQKTFGADCFSCARCLNVCPQDAIRYTSVFSRAAAGTQKEQCMEN